jgi:hypothetical protein
MSIGVGLGVGGGVHSGVVGALGSTGLEDLGTLVSYYSYATYTVTTTTIVSTPELAAANAIPNVWESDNPANQPTPAVAFVNGHDAALHASGDVMHIQSPEQFASPGPSPMDLTDFTIGVTFRCTSIGANQMILSEDYTASESEIYVGTDGSIVFWNGSGNTTIAPAATIAIDTWYALVFRRISGAWKVYANASDVTSGSPSESTDMTPQMSFKSGSGNVYNTHVMIYSNGISIANVNTLGQTLTDFLGLADSWALS